MATRSKNSDVSRDLEKIAQVAALLERTRRSRQTLNREMAHLTAKLLVDGLEQIQLCLGVSIANALLF